MNIHGYGKSKTNTERRTGMKVIMGVRHGIVNFLWYEGAFFRGGSGV